MGFALTALSDFEFYLFHKLPQCSKDLEHYQDCVAAYDSKLEREPKQTESWSVVIMTAI